MPDIDMVPNPRYDWGTPPGKKALYTQTFTVFNSAQTIEQDAALSASSSSLVPFQQTMQYYHRLSGLYRSAAREYMGTLDAQQLEEWQNIHTILHLAEVLYFPSDGRGVGVVGEELLHWLNSFDFAPTTEEGQEIAQAATPHSHPAYWDYILRCVLRGFHNSAASVLKSLHNHKASAVRRVADKAASLLASLPRSTAFGMEHEFIAAHRGWVARVRNVLSGLEQEMDDMEAEAGHTEESEDERLEYEAQFRCLFELMAGVKDRIFEACEDWREALGAWGTLVQPTMKRDDVPGTMELIFQHFPIDGTLAHELVQSHLVKGQVPQAVSKAKDVDIWLAAHLGDLVDKAGLLEEESQLRTQLFLDYANYMVEEEGLWRISIDYLAVCGAEGRKKMRKVILSVPYISDNTEEEEEKSDDECMDDSSSADTIGKENKAQDKADGFQRAQEILRACADHNMEDEARVVCKRLARAMTSSRRYGVAVAYCVQAGDAIQICRIADQLLEEYVQKGAQTFIALVDSIPSSLLAPSANFAATMDSASVFGPVKGFFSKRLAFLARYRDFQRLYAEESLRAAAQLLVELITSEAVPESFLAVLLVDAIPLLEDEELLLDARETSELMRIVEQVTWSVSAHPDLEDHYLGYLNRLVGGVRKDTGEKLDVVRLGLAWHLARVSVTAIPEGTE